MLTKLFKPKVSTADAVKIGVITGLLEIVYIVLVAGFLTLAEEIFPSSANPVIGVVALLTLLVFSAGISGLLVFGAPFYLALQKNYPTAGLVLAAAGATLAAVFVLIILGELFIY